eukprot:11368931-Alexandrium_andersonii.AAC.1
MSASLVGSEMCIRDRARARNPAAAFEALATIEAEVDPLFYIGERRLVAPVSYTHLTLPTICSV